MLALFQLLLAVFAIYSALKFEEEWRLIIPLICLVLMLIVGRVEKRTSEKKTARKTFLQTEIDKIWKKEATTIKEQDFFTIESLVWPKSELLLVDAVHFIFKDLGFKISAGVDYHSVDRIVKIPNTTKAFGLIIMMSEREADKKHPKIVKALQFEKEKRQGEKTLIIASTHIHLPLSERSGLTHISKDLSDLLVLYNIGFITAHHLFDLWQRAKGGEIDIFGFFEKFHSHREGPLFSKGIANSSPTFNASSR